MFTHLKLSMAQLVILHLLESLLASFALTIAAGTFQYIALHGLDVAGLGAFWASTFLGSLAMIYKSLSGNPQFGQAVMDSIAELKGLVSSQQAPLVAIHATSPSVSVPPGSGMSGAPAASNGGTFSQDTAPWSAISALNLPSQGQGQQGR